MKRLWGSFSMRPTSNHRLERAVMREGYAPRAPEESVRPRR